MIDPELEKALEDLDIAKRRADQRSALIEEALIELVTSESVQLEGYLGYGRTLLINDEVRTALERSGKEELETLKRNLEEARQRVMDRRALIS